MRITALLAGLALGAALVGCPARADLEADYLELVERGWNYDFRGSARGMAPTLPPSYVMARTMAPRGICLVGDVPHPVMAETLQLFRSLLRSIFGTAGPVSAGKTSVGECGEDDTVFIRFYSAYVPNDLFNADIDALDARFGLGFSGRQHLAILSPAQAVTMFGRTGQITHLSLLEPLTRRITGLERDFYRSLLIEELYQSYSFGLDIFKMGPGGPYLSKLQETPVDLRFLDWTSPDYMAGLLHSNPQGLCHFDVMMLHALAEYRPGREGRHAFTDYVATHFGALYDQARETAAKPDFADLLDPDCASVPPR